MTDQPHMDVQMSTECAALFEALSAFQGEATAPKKTATNPHFKSKFADLAEVMDAARAPLAKHGLSLTQLPIGQCDGFVRVVTLLGHKSGQWLKGTLDMPLPQKTPQGVGSAISYARRYCAMAVLGLAAEDDDGEAAEGRNAGPARAQQQARQQSGKDPARVLATLRDELAKMGNAEKLAQFHNHAIRELDEASVAEQPRNEFWSAWGARCKALNLEPKKVAADARALQQRAA